MKDESIEEMEWLQKRLGHFTASSIHKLFVSGRGKNPELFGQGALTYIRERVAERLTMDSKEQLDFKQTEWGKTYEAEAVKKFEKYIGKAGIHYGVLNPKFFSWGEYAGGSPDWEFIPGDTVENSEGADIKCPYNSSIHIENFLINSIDEFKDKRFDYYCQGQLNMLIRGWKKFHFVSYDPRMIDPAFQLKVISMYPDSNWVAEFDARLQAAIEESNRIIAAMSSPGIFVAALDPDLNTIIIS